MLAVQILHATAAKPALITAGLPSRTPGAYLYAWTSKGTVYVKSHGRASLNPGPFAVPKAKTVLKAGTAVRAVLDPHKRMHRQICVSSPLSTPVVQHPRHSRTGRVRFLSPLCLQADSL